MATIIQWNVNSIEQNQSELELLLKDNPSVVCLQETKAKATIKRRGYTSYDVFAEASDGRACGGVSILINNKVPQSEVTINSTLQAVAVKVTLHKTLTICSIYCPPSKPIAYAEFENLFSQLSPPVLLLGDFNSHSTQWGENITNARGRIIEKFIAEQNLCILNDGSKTFLHSGNGTSTAIDLSLCHPSIFLDFKWKISDDLSGSDHYPIFIDTVLPQPMDSFPRWVLHKANWPLFSQLCEESLAEHNFNEDPNPIDTFTNIIIDIANKSVPKTSGKRKKKYKPWFNEECKDAIKARQHALNTFKQHPSFQNLDNFKIFRAKARRTIRANKKRSWQDYVSQLNNKSSLKKTWDIIRKINGKYVAPAISHISKDNTEITEFKDIANCLGSSFAKNSSAQNYNPNFQIHKASAEKIRLNFKTKTISKYNRKFTLKELTSSIKKAHDSSPGPDRIHYQFLKHLPMPCLAILLDIFNGIWEDGKYPSSWSEALIIPIPKPGKDPSNDNSYRPIALTSCLCKIMERIINNRLVWFLESNNLLTALQSGFRKSRCTTDHLIRLETFIRHSFIKKEHNVAIFFDLEKAYDTTWKYGIMKDLYDFGLRGNLPIFIEKFLNDRTFHVRVGSTLSDNYVQEVGVPQGSILSVTLFSIKINSIVKCLTQGTNGSLYVDDFQISFGGQHMRTIERQLQLCLKKLEIWANENGFKFSTSKTVCVHFCRKRGYHPDPKLKLYGDDIPVLTQVKFLGVIFDNKLTFHPHILALKQKCQKALNLLRVVSHMDWGGDRETLLRLYKSLILSKLDYGCIIYGSAAKSYLAQLDPVQNEGLRLCLGAYKTSNAESLEVEANIPPLTLRREQLTLQYMLKLKANPLNPTYTCVFNPPYLDKFAANPKTIAPLGIRLKETISHLNINLDTIATSILPKTPPWTFEPFLVNWELSQYLKSDTSSDIYKAEFKRITRCLYHDCDIIYTDGSKQNEIVGCAAVGSFNISIKQKLPDYGSIFTAELTAIDLALELIEDNLPFISKKILICSDSQSALQILQNDDFTNPLVTNVRERMNTLISMYRVTITFLWVPGHVQIKGNEVADRLAKESLQLEGQSNDKLPFTDFKSLVKPFIKDKWQHYWAMPKPRPNKLFEVKPLLGSWLHSSRKSRREEIVLARIRIGHTHLTHSYLRKGEEPPFCISCDCHFTVKHFLLECAEYNHIRQNYFDVTTMKDLFETVRPEVILDYLRDIDLFHKI